MSGGDKSTRCDLFVFGANDEGQLGTGCKEEKVFIPTRAIRGASFWSMSIVGGSKHTLLQDEHGNVFVAGQNTDRQLGYFNSSPPNSKVAAIEDPAQTSLCEFTLKRNDVAFCAATWDSSAYVLQGSATEALNEVIHTEGKGLDGELGRGACISTAEIRTVRSSAGSYLDPLDPLPDQVRSFAAGHSHYVAVLKNGQVWGWGKANKSQLGDLQESSTKKISEPRQLPDIGFEAVKIVCGKEFTYIVADPADGRHLILGQDKGGLKSNMPASIQNWKDIGATWNAIYVLYQDGTLQAWGKEFLYQLVPPGLPPLDQIAIGSEHVLALTRASDTSPSKLISWGWGEHGNCGDVSTMDPPPAMPRCCVTGRWNEIDIPGSILSIGAAQATSFVLTEVRSQSSNLAEVNDVVELTVQQNIE
ncbi:RCC1/BLIP-II [Aaosphaeria arxii CBS 175.79]|uniref:RCC1/BLIP-II n=1 Tax=Aaosphaeria arxii CBS 175.79 TaxID=1450172 RepID=A0A6A5XSL9_9PLEO|nr:RCC1/BLIP-II [Aaosphaeria arxii CBS 175.79]KAF2016298.1 RCC1/BLIP-II [Aaosphaeria arxii CBS 175.79]